MTVSQQRESANRTQLHAPTTSITTPSRRIPHSVVPLLLLVLSFHFFLFNDVMAYGSTQTFSKGLKHQATLLIRGVQDEPDTAQLQHAFKVRVLGATMHSHHFTHSPTAYPPPDCCKAQRRSAAVCSLQCRRQGKLAQGTAQMHR